VASGLADWLEVAVPKGLTVFDFVESHKWRIFASYVLEQINQEIKR
jgi:hypothetical protein